MKRLVRVTAAALASLAIPASTGAAVLGAAEGPESPAQLLTGAGVQVIDADQGVVLSRGIVAHAAIAEGCTLVLGTDPDSAGASEIPLGDLLFVQGDGGAMVNITTRTERQRELIFTVENGRYAALMDLLSSQARRCGAELVGPPRIVTTP